MLIEDLDSLPSPYTREMLSGLSNRIVYFESSRGCPFSCSYCISSTFSGVRYFSMNRVKTEISKLIASGAKQVKFVDRTFNCSKKRVKEIFEFVIYKYNEESQKQNDFSTNFHFEAAGDLFDDELLEVLSLAPKGLIQLEIGIQSTSRITHELVSRKTDINKLFLNVSRLISYKNIHIHLDLIAGLPGEGIDSFRNSFNEVFYLKPQQLQLGFLKLLKGSRIREEADLHGYKFRQNAPYELLCSKYISYDELVELKGIEEVLERYFNSCRFNNILEYLINRYFKSPYDFFNRLLSYFRSSGSLNQKLSSRQLYSILLQFANSFCDKDEPDRINELLKLDYLSTDNSNNLPEGIKRSIYPGFKEACFEFLKKKTNIERYLPEFNGIPAKQIFKQVHFEIFKYDVFTDRDSVTLDERETIMVFDYKSKDRVTGIYRYEKVRL